MGSSGVYRWEFDKGGQSLVVGVNGPLIIDDMDVSIRAAIAGIGLAYSFEEYLGAGRRRSLIENTLRAFDGECTLRFVVNDVVHIVKRNSKKREVQLRIGSEPFVVASASQIRSLLPIQAYSQKQLSSVGVRIEELRRFVSLPIRDELELLNAETRSIQAKARSAYGDLARNASSTPRSRPMTLRPND